MTYTCSLGLPSGVAKIRPTIFKHPDFTINSNQLEHNDKLTNLGLPFLEFLNNCHLHAQYAKAKVKSPFIM